MGVFALWIGREMGYELSMGLEGERSILRVRDSISAC